MINAKYYCSHILMMAVRPYSFEPTRRVHVEDSTCTDISDIEDNLNPPPASRLGNTLWCSCAQCIPQATEHECVCCRELEDVLCILSQESVRLTCIVDHPEFAATVCLNPLVLRVALAGTVAMRGERIPLPLERNPFVMLMRCTEAITNGTENTHLLNANNIL